MWYVCDDHWYNHCVNNGYNEWFSECLNGHLHAAQYSTQEIYELDAMEVQLLLPIFKGFTMHTLIDMGLISRRWLHSESSDEEVVKYLVYKN